MNGIFGAGFFDNPWIVVAFFVGSALVNWISQQRQQRRRQENQIPRESSPQTQPASDEFDPEELVRRLFGDGDRPESPPPLPEPPSEPRPRRPIREVTTLPSATPAHRLEDGVTEMELRTPPELLSPLSPSVGMGGAPVQIAESGAPAQSQFPRLGSTNSVAVPKVRAVDQRDKHTVPLRGRSNRWRDRRTLRGAFVASLLFSTPKGLEP